MSAIKPEPPIKRRMRVPDSEIAGPSAFVFPQDPIKDINILPDSDSDKSKVMYDYLAITTEAKSNSAVNIQAVIQKCCIKHEGIEFDKNVLGGLPVIKGTRIDVGFLLNRLSLYGNINDVIEQSVPHLTEQQIREAIAFASDFVEMICAESESDAG